MDAPERNYYQRLIQITRELGEINDVDAILDRVLLEARRLTNAEAGSLFLVEGKRLRFSYVQNERLFDQEGTNKAVYEDFTLPIDDHSIVGYCASSGQNLNIADAYHLPPGTPYAFNDAFDRQSGFCTRSILALPLKGMNQRVIGVIQLINVHAPDGQGPFPFDPEMERLLPLFTNNATVAIEQGLLTRELILRMMKMAELRDPTETGAHVLRVGSYAAEIYHQWAIDHHIPTSERKRTKGLIRVASMLHDVGKVGISDLILKKPGKLTDPEFRIMQWHTVFGARLFANTTSDLDQMAMEIALNHHEKWDGGGYPGKIPDLHSDEAVMGEPKRGEEIPLAARITALADVFDALCSKRVYKEAWQDEEILDLLREQSGRHFDPEVVNAFLAVFQVIVAIRSRHREGHGSNLSLEEIISQH